MLLERSLREDIAVALDLPADLWPVEVDPGELEVALFNLAVNARDAMPNGGQLTITARNVPGDPATPFPIDHVCLSVEDTGMGVPSEVVNRMFETLFHHQGRRQGHGPGAQSGLWLRPLVRRAGRHRQLSGGLGRAFRSAYLAAPRRRRPMPGPTAGPPTPRGAPRSGS